MRTFCLIVLALALTLRIAAFALDNSAEAAAAKPLPPQAAQTR